MIGLQIHSKTNSSSAQRCSDSAAVKNPPGAPGQLLYGFLQSCEPVSSPPVVVCPTGWQIQPSSRDSTTSHVGPWRDFHGTRVDRRVEREGLRCPVLAAQEGAVVRRCSRVQHESRSMAGAVDCNHRQAPFVQSRIDVQPAVPSAPSGRRRWMRSESRMARCFR